MRPLVFLTCLGTLLLAAFKPTLVGGDNVGAPWRSLPLIEDGRAAADWVQIGWGGFGVVENSLRTDCDEKGMGLLLYKKERFGNCQIRVVFKAQDTKSNAGVFVRIDEGILDWIAKKPAAIKRDEKGKLSQEMLQKLMDQSQAKEGAWYAVHHGYEVQICEEGDAVHRTGAIYSLAKADEAPRAKPGAWRTMIVTLDGNLVLIDIDGKRVTRFDPDGKDVPKARKWFEPMREPKRPVTGYIGLQNHDPGDVDFFKEISVRPLLKR
jgi:hydrogenase maturation factor